MYQDFKNELTGSDALAEAGTDVVAYLRKISSEEILEKFPDVTGIESGRIYWAMFAADGSPLMLADERTDLTDTAYFNDLQAILPN